MTSSCPHAIMPRIAGPPRAPPATGPDTVASPLSKPDDGAQLPPQAVEILGGHRPPRRGGLPPGGGRNRGRRGHQQLDERVLQRGRPPPLVLPARWAEIEWRGGDLA